MAKIDINFNNTSYTIDESALQIATDAIKSHLSTVMNGSGSVINFGGISYNVDSSKLSSATADFISHIGTVAGSGYKVVVNGTEYSIDSSKMSRAVSDLEAVLGGLNSGGSGGWPYEPIVWDCNMEGYETIVSESGIPFIKLHDEYISNADVESIVANVGGQTVPMPVEAMVEDTYGWNCTDSFICIKSQCNFNGLGEGLWMIDFVSIGEPFESVTITPKTTTV